MKRFTLTLSLLVAMITTAMAQETINISAVQNLTQQWTSTGLTDGEGSYTLWSTEVINDYPAGITPSNDNEVHMATTNVTISELGHISFTLKYTSGDHRLNILGVDLLNGEEVIAHDYHKGQTGSSSSNNTYTFFVTSGGNYTLRYFVEHHTGSNDLRRTNGTITGKFTACKTSLVNYMSSFSNVGLWTADEMEYILSITNEVEDANINTPENFNTFETSYRELFHKIIEERYFTFNSKGRNTTNGRFLSVSPTNGVCVDGTMKVVAVDAADELKNIWKLEYVNENYYRLKNIAYDVYTKPIDENSLGGDITVQTTPQQNEAGLFYINTSNNNGNIAFGAKGGGTYSYMHEKGNSEITRWTADAGASQWTAQIIEEPELCSITYNYTLDGVKFRTENVNVIKGTEYTFVKNYTEKAGMRLTTEIPAAEVITENKVITYEYENILPFEPATVTSENRLAQGSKLYKITLRGKNVQLTANGTEFEYSNNGAIENRLFALTGTIFDDWQIFNYAAGLNKPIWSPDNNNGTKMVPTAGVTDKLEIVLYNDNTGNHWSFKKKGTNYYLHDYGSKFAVWNDNTAYDDAGSYVVFTEATEKEICIADLNMEIMSATHYLALLDDATAKENLQNAINAANTAIADEASTVEQIKEHGETIKQLTEVAIQTLNITTANGFNNNGVYTFVTSRGWLVYNNENPDVVASTASYTSLAKGNDKAYCQWAMHKSTNTGFYYMYNIGADKFVGNPSSGDRIPFVAEPTNDIKILAGTKNGYPIIVATNTTSVINHFNHTGVPGVANWTDGQNHKADDGSCHMVTKVALIADTTLTKIADMLDIYESYVNKPILEAKITELTTFKESSFLTEEEKTAITTAIEDAQAAYDNAEQQRYSIFAQHINKLNGFKFVLNINQVNNNCCYTVSTESKGSWISEVTVETDSETGEETQIARLNSTNKLDIAYNVTDNKQQFAFVKSPVTEDYYLYSVSANSFVSKEGGYTKLTEAPVQTISFLDGERSADYPWVIALNTAEGEKQIAISNGYTPGVITTWNDKTDSGNTVRLEIANTFDPTAALEQIDIYESHINKPDLLAKITELTEFKASSFLTDDEKAAIQTEIDNAQAVYDNPKYSTVAAEIARLNGLTLERDLKYVWDISSLSNTVCYTVSADTRGSWFSEETHLNSTGKVETPGDATKLHFAFVKSDISGNYYLYSVGENKFVSISEADSQNNTYTKLTELPEQSISFLEGTYNENYPWVIALNVDGNKKQLGISNGSYTYGVITFYNDLTDQGNNVRLEKIAAFDPTNALAEISKYETNAIKAELLEKIGEANEYSAKTYLPENKRTELSTAAATAQGVYDDANATYDAVVEQIEFIEDLLNHCVYVTSPEGFSNNAVYTIVAKYNNGNAYVMWDANQGDNGNYAISSSKNFGTTIETGAEVPGCQWALYTSESGKHYLYNIGAGKFMGTSNEGNGYIPLNEKPTSADLILKNSAIDEYPIMFSVNNGAGVLNHNNGNSFPYGLLNWHSTQGWNDTSSASNIHKVTVVGALEEETLATIEELVEEYETVGVKQQELKTLLDNIHSGYYDAWASNGGAWRINPGVNNYSQPEGDEDFVTAYNDARNYETSENIAAIEAQIARMNGLVANLTINQPESGKYYRIRCTDDTRNDGKKKLYLSSNTNDAGRLQMIQEKNESNIFYYKDGRLVSYAKGVHIHAVSDNNHIKLRDVEQTSIATFIDGKDNGKSGSYLINIKNSDDNGNGRYIHGKNDTSDSGSTKPSNNQDGYNWWLEEVTELPVTITDAGYASFYAPVAVTIPSGIEAYYLTKIIGEFASMTKIEGTIPANTGVMLTGAYGEPSTEGTYDFEVTSDVSPIEGNMFEGTVAAEYVTGDAYVLANGNNGVGLYLATLNQEGKFKNNSHKAYLPASSVTSTMQQSAGFSFRFNAGATTAVEKVEMRNEKEEIYDLTGRKLEGISGTGIYIINGKKVLVK